MAAAIKFPKSVIGEDGILRSEVEYDPKSLPVLSNTLGMHFFKLVQKCVKERGDRVFLTNALLALEEKDQDNLSYASITLSTFSEKANKLSRALHHLGIGKGDAVGIYLPNTTEFHCIVLATWLVQGIVSAGDPYLTVEGFASQLEDVKPKVVVCYPENKDLMLMAIQSLGLEKSTYLIVVSLQDKVETSEMVFNYLDLLEDDDKYPDIPNHHQTDAYCQDDTVMVIWSSGTTGRPKGILSSAQQILSMSQWGGVPPLDFIQTTCFFHGGGIVLPLVTINKGNKHCFFPIESLESEDCARLLFKAAERFKPHTFMAGSHHVMRMYIAPTQTSRGLDLSSVKFVTPLGAAVPDDLDSVLRRHFPQLLAMLNFYGQSEFGHLIAKSMTPKHLGYVSPGVEIKIVDPMTKRPCGPNKTGAILIRGVIRSKGYLNRPEENAKLFEKDGFMHSGDLGHYDKDGILYFDGRLKEVIKYQNIHVYPAEIEHLIETHPDVIQAGVFGKLHQQDQEHPTAVVVKKEGSSVSGEDIQELVQSRLDRARWLRGGVYFVKELPCGPQGKVQRKRLFEAIK